MSRNPRGRATQLLVCVVMSWAALPVRAQVGMTFDSLEWMTAKATCIVRAEVFDVSVLPRSEGRLWFRALLRVHETLKGGPAEEVVYYAPGWPGQAHPLETLDADCLWFLGPWPEMNNGPVPEVGAFYGYQEWMDQAWFPLEDSQPYPHAVFTMDVQVLDTPAQILAHTRIFCASPPSEPLASAQFEIPREVALRTGRAGDANGLVVPVVPRLEALARAWIKCEAEWYPEPGGSEEWEPERLRAWRERATQINAAQTFAGLRAISAFKSAENIALLKSCAEGDSFDADWAQRILLEWGAVD